MRNIAAAALCAIVLAASCASGAADSDLRAAAIQSMIDATPDGALAFRAIPAGVAHIQSGLVCLSGHDDTLRLTGLEVIDKGRGVGCKYRLESGYMELFAMRLDRETIETFENENFGGFEKENPTAHRIEDPLKSASPGETLPLSRAYQQTAPDGERVTAIWIGEANGWAISVYATNLLDAHKKSEAFGAIAWMIGADGVLGIVK